jgi:hypothetical protein
MTDNREINNLIYLSESMLNEEEKWSIEELADTASYNMDKWMPAGPDTQDEFEEGSMADRIDMVMDNIDNFFDREVRGYSGEEREDLEDFISDNYHDIVRAIAI